MFWWLIRDFTARNKLLIPACALFSGFSAMGIFAMSAADRNFTVYYPAFFLPLFFLRQRFLYTDRIHRSLPVSRRQIELFRWIIEVLYVPLFATLFTAGWGLFVSQHLGLHEALSRLVLYGFCSVLISGCMAQSQALTPQPRESENQRDFAFMFTARGLLAGLFSLPAMILAFRPIVTWQEIDWIGLPALATAVVVNVLFVTRFDIVFKYRAPVLPAARQQPAASSQRRGSSRLSDFLVPWKTLGVNMVSFAAYMLVFLLIFHEISPSRTAGGSPMTFLWILFPMACLNASMQWAFCSREFRALPLTRRRMQWMMLAFPLTSYVVCGAALLLVNAYFGTAASPAVLACFVGGAGLVLLAWTFTAAFGQVAMAVAVMLVIFLLMFGFVMAIFHGVAVMAPWILCGFGAVTIPGAYFLLGHFVSSSSDFYKPKRLGRPMFK